MSWVPKKTRVWLHGIGLAALPLLVLYGIIEDQDAPLWAALLGAIIVPGVGLNDTAKEDGKHATAWSKGYRTAQQVQRHELDESQIENPYLTVLKESTGKQGGHELQAGEETDQ